MLLLQSNDEPFFNIIAFFVSIYYLEFQNETNKLILTLIYFSSKHAGYKFEIIG